MEISKQDIKDIKDDLKQYPKTKAYYYIVYASTEKESLEIMQKGIYAKSGELK